MNKFSIYNFIGLQYIYMKAKYIVKFKQLKNVLKNLINE